MSQKFATNWDEVPLIIDLPFVAIMFGSNVDYLKKLAREGKFPAFKFGEKLWRVDKADLRDWIEKQKNLTKEAD